MTEDTPLLTEGTLYPKVALVDADFMVYQIGFADKDATLQMQKNSVTEWLTDIVYMKLNCVDYKAYLTGKGNFRDAVAKTQPYKGNRKDVAKPIYYDELRKHLQRLGAVVCTGYEADDAVCVEAHASDYWIVHVDKDLDQIPGWHYNPKKDIIYHVDAFKAEYNFYTQLLTGDRVDNIPGIRGIGPKKAEKILEGCSTVEDMVSAVKEVYKDKGFNDEYYDEQFKLLRLLTCLPQSND